MFLIVKSECSHCRNMKKAVMSVNRDLPKDRQIDVVDSRFLENYGVDLEPIMEKVRKGGLKEGYPFCFLITDEENMQGIILESSEPKILKAYLYSLLKEVITK